MDSVTVVALSPLRDYRMFEDRSRLVHKLFLGCRSSFLLLPLLRSLRSLKETFVLRHTFSKVLTRVVLLSIVAVVAFDDRGGGALFRSVRRRDLPVREPARVDEHLERRPQRRLPEPRSCPGMWRQRRYLRDSHRRWGLPNRLQQ